MPEKYRKLKIYCQFEWWIMDWVILKTNQNKTKKRVFNHQWSSMSWDVSCLWRKLFSMKSRDPLPSNETIQSRRRMASRQRRAPDRGPGTTTGSRSHHSTTASCCHHPPNSTDPAPTSYWCYQHACLVPTYKGFFSSNLAHLVCSSWSWRTFRTVNRGDFGHLFCIFIKTFMIMNRIQGFVMGLQSTNKGQVIVYIPGGPQKNGTVNFSGLCSDQQ